MRTARTPISRISAKVILTGGVEAIMTLIIPPNGPGGKPLGLGTAADYEPRP
jgi:hypothetical protein